MGWDADHAQRSRVSAAPHHRLFCAQKASAQHLAYSSGVLYTMTARLPPGNGCDRAACGWHATAWKVVHETHKPAAAKDNRFVLAHRGASTPPSSGMNTAAPIGACSRSSATTTGSCWRRCCTPASPSASAWRRVTAVRVCASVWQQQSVLLRVQDAGRTASQVISTTKSKRSTAFAV